MRIDTPDVEITVKKNLTVEHQLFIFEKVKEILCFLNDKEVETSKDSIVKIKKMADVSEELSNTSELPEESSFDKDRLPNPIMRNGVFLEPSEIEKIKTFETMYRCPECGQHKAIILDLDNKYVFMKLNKENSYDLVYDNFKEGNEIPDSLFLRKTKDQVLSKLDYQDFIKSLDELPTKDDPVVFDLDKTTGHCPFCKSKNEMKEWVEAYEHPENYFEYNGICEDCGGEIEMITKKKAIKSQCIRCGKDYGDVKNENGNSSTISIARS